MLWPNNKKFAICISHDVDRVHKAWWHCISHFMKTKRMYHFKTLFTRWRENPYWNFEKIMEIEEKYDVKSTFFFLNESGKANLLDKKTYPIFFGRYKIKETKVKEIIKELDKGGWEIGVHGSYYSFKNFNLLKREKEILEGIVGHKVIGIRQHYLNLDPPHTWILQKNAGFLYDASFGFRDNIGFRDDKILPFRPFNDEFLVIPLTVMDGALFKKYPTTNDAWNIILKLIEYSEKKHALLTILWHQRVFNENEFPHWSKMYERIIQEGKRRHAWFARCRDVWEVCKDGC